VLDGDSAITLSVHPSVNVTRGFAIRSVVVQAAGNNGYIFAKTDANGIQRYYALYASAVSSALVFYFTPGAGSESLSVSWPVTIADGRPHLVEFVVTTEGRALLSIDRQAQGERTLRGGGIADCAEASASCVFMLGGRAAGPGTSSFELRGAIFRAEMTEGHPPVWSTERGLALLTSTAGLAIAPATSGEDAALAFSGATSGGALVVEAEGVAVPSSGFVSVNIRFRQQTNNNGYLFSKASGSGTRHFALLSRGAAGEMILYYTSEAGAQATQRAAVFSASVADGQWHVVVLSVTGQNATLTVDNKEPQTATLNGAVTDCGAPSANCFLHLGQRASPEGGTSFLEGAISWCSILPGFAL
jgi:hypothetical protein